MLHEMADYDALRDQNGVIFSVTGWHHPPSYWRAHPIYQPDTQSPNGYRKIVYDPDAQQAVGTPYERIDDLLLLVPHSAVAAYMSARQVFSQRRQGLPTAVGTFIDLLLEKASIAPEHVGLFGSWQAGIEKPGSDVDIVFYGAKTYRAFASVFAQLREEAGLQLVPETAARQKAAIFAHLLGISTELAAHIIQLRSTKYVVGETMLSISFAYGSANETPQLALGKPLKPISLQNALVEAENAVFTPRLYMIQAEEQRYTVLSERYFFKEVAQSGDRVDVQGMLHDNHVITIARRGDYIAPARTNSP